MSIKVAREVIMDAKCKTFGYGAAIAASSIITENIRGKGIDEALKISHETVSDIMAQIPEERFSCLTLAANALR
jgi:NifU-like protein involved in Fe-S cluster formation